MILVLSRVRSHRAPNLGYRGAGSPGWLDISPRDSAWDVMHERMCCCDEAANHYLPIAAAFWIIWVVSMEECSSLMQNLMQIHCSSCSVIWNTAATQYTCLFNGIYCPHWLVQWSIHCSHVCILVHFPWLSGYIDVMQTVLIIVTMAGLFPDRLIYMYVCVCVCIYIYIYSLIYIWEYIWDIYVYIW